jgi:hypothetical protein
LNLEPKESAYGSSRYESGLMRVAFVRGNPSESKLLYGGPVLSDAEPYRSFLMRKKVGIDSWQKEFHNYTMVWRPGEYLLTLILRTSNKYGSLTPNQFFTKSVTTLK